MTVYHELDPELKLPLVPIVQNCAVKPMMPLRRYYEFGVALGEAIRSYDGLDRVAVVAAGGLSHFIGVPRVGDIDEEFDRWFLDKLESGYLDALLDMPDEEIELAGNGAHEIRSWIAAAGTVRAGPRPHHGLRADLPVDHRHGRVPLPAHLMSLARSVVVAPHPDDAAPTGRSVRSGVLVATRSVTQQGLALPSTSYWRW